MYDFNGQLPRADLDDGFVEIEKINELTLGKYLGGRGLALHFLLKEQEPRSDPLGPDSRLVFATGITAGIPLQRAIAFIPLEELAFLLRDYAEWGLAF
jgi:aldehyde:ferredoxin oxidoreductase